MAISSIFFAAVTSLTLGGTEILGITAAQANLSYETKPLYNFNSFDPAIIISIPNMGSGSFTVFAKPTELNFSTMFDTDANGKCPDIVISGFCVKSSPTDLTDTAKTITLKECQFQGQQFSLGARQEGYITVNFACKTWE